MVRYGLEIRIFDHRRNKYINKYVNKFKVSTDWYKCKNIDTN